MKTSINVSKSIVVITLLALVGMGQSCSIPFFSSKQDATDGGIFRSDDHGQTWKQKNAITTTKGAGSLRNVSMRILVPDPQTPNRWFAGTAGAGLFVTTDNGDHWSTTSLKSGDFSCLAFQTTDHEVLYASAGSSIVKSIDSGKTWKTVYSDTQGSAMGCVGVSPQAPLTIFAVSTSGKILESIDGGKNWSLMTSIHAVTPRKMLISPDGSTVTIFGRSEGIFVVDVANKSWQDISKSLKDLPGAKNIRSVVALETPEPVWFMATNYGLIRSTDHGSTWQAIQTLDKPGTISVQNVLVNPNDTKEIFISVGKKIERTNDGGKTWTVSSIRTTRSLVQLVMDPNSVDRLFIATYIAQ